MVRVFFVRHAESVENLAMEQPMRENLFESGAMRWEDIMPLLKKNTPEHGCAPLTDLGMSQAESLGRFWAPKLSGRASEGKLHVFVSPQQRTIRTVGMSLFALNCLPSTVCSQLTLLPQVPSCAACTPTAASPHN